MTDGPHQTPPPPPPAAGAPQGAPAPPPPGPAPAPKKKGLSPLAWIGIGCGGIVLLGLIAFVIVGGWLFGKAKDVAKDYQDNPAMASAKIVVKLNPEWELVDSDDDAGTLTIRDKKTGEETTVDLQDVEDGQISFKSGDEEMTVGMEKDDEGGGAFTVRDKEGKSRFRVGSGGGDELPGLAAELSRGPSRKGTFLSSSDAQTNGGFGFKTDDAVDDVIAFYEDALEGDGFEITGRNSTQSGDTELKSINAEAEDRTIQVMVITDRSSDGESQVTVTFSDKTRLASRAPKRRREGDDPAGRSPARARRPAPRHRYRSWSARISFAPPITVSRSPSSEHGGTPRDHQRAAAADQGHQHALRQRDLA